MEMKDFDLKLLRLKTVLGVTDDQEVAALLGLSKAAFSARKQRDSFPEIQLQALVATRPDLKIDACYVLTGDYLSVAQAKAGARKARQANVVSQDLTADEQELIALYRAAPLAVKLAAVAALASTGTPPGTSGKYAGATVGAIHEQAPKKMTIKQDFSTKKDK